MALYDCESVTFVFSLYYIYIKGTKLGAKKTVRSL